MEINLALAAVTALIGALAGYGLRLREIIRGDRKSAYLRYLQAVDKLPLAFIQAHAYAQGRDTLETAEDASLAVAAAEAELTITASRRVLAAVQELRSVIRSPNLMQLMTSTLGTDPAPTQDERERRELLFLQGYAELVLPHRKRVLNRMRRDLGVRVLPKDSSLEAPTWA